MRSRTRSGIARLGAVSVLGGTLLVTAPPATAACHAFTMSASSERVAEGETVTVTVFRDANVGPSRVDVSTIDETARAGTDYVGLDETAEFMLETELTFTIPVNDDGEAEEDETFRVHLSNPDGCSVNPNFELGPDLTIAIVDNDGSRAAPAPAAPAQSDTTAVPRTEASGDDSGTLASSGAVAAGAGLAAAGAGFLLVVVRRRLRSP